MALAKSFEKEGSFLFRYRGQISLALLIATIPIVYFTKFKESRRS